MIYAAANLEEPIDQGDLIDDCPVTELKNYLVGQPETLAVDYDRSYAVETDFPIAPGFSWC